jgi:hypothetical protein
LHNERLKFFGTQHRDQQVREQKKSNHTHNDVFHKFPLKLFAEAHVQSAYDEKHNYDSDEQQIQHDIRFEFRSNTASATPHWSRLYASHRYA